MAKIIPKVGDGRVKSSGVQRASVNLPNLDKARYRSNNLVSALGNLAITAVDETVTQKYVADFEKGKERVLFPEDDSDSFENIIAESKETPWYLKPFSGGELDGAREAQFANTIVNLRNKTIDEMEQYEGLSAKDYDKLLQTSVNDFLTEDDTFNEQFKKYARNERMELLERQQVLHKDYNIRQATQRTVELFVGAGQVEEASDVRELAINTINNNLNTDAKDTIIESLETIIKSQVIAGESSFVDALIASQTDTKIRDKLLDFKEEAIEVKYNKGSTIYESKLLEAKTNIALSVRDPRVAPKELTKQITATIQEFGLTPKEQAPLMKQLVSHKRFYRKLLADKAKERKGQLSMLALAANAEDLARLEKSFAERNISVSQFKERMAVKYQRGLITKGQFVSAIKKAEKVKIDDHFITEYERVEEDLSSVASFEQGLNIIASSRLSTKRKEAMVEDWESQRAKAEQGIINTVNDNLEIIDDTAIEQMIDSTDLTSPTREGLNRLLANKLKLRNQSDLIGMGVLKGNSVRVTEELKPHIEFQIMNEDTTQQERINLIHALDKVPNEVSTNIKHFVNNVNKFDDEADIEAVVPHIQMLSDYAKQYGEIEAIKRFNLGSGGQALLETVLASGDIESGMLNYSLGSTLPNETTKKDKRALLTDIVSELPDNPYADLYAERALESYKQANPLATDEQVVKGVIADLENKSTSGVLGLPKTRIESSPLSYADDISGMTEDFVRGVLVTKQSPEEADNFIDSHSLSTSYDEVNDRMVITAINNETGSTYVQYVAIDAYEDYYKTTEQYREIQERLINEDAEYAEQARKAIYGESSVSGNSTRRGKRRGMNDAR